MKPSFCKIFYCFMVMHSLQDLKGRWPHVASYITVFFDDLVDDMFYIDKTLIIKDFMTMSRANVLVTAPKKWYKTSAIETIKNFLQIFGHAYPVNVSERCQVFKNMHYAIANDTEFFDTHCGKHPLIHITWNVEHMEMSFQKFLKELRTFICDGFAEHEFLEDSAALDEDERKLFSEYANMYKYPSLPIKLLETSFRFLSKLLHKHFNKKVIVLIDDLDRPIFDIIDSVENFTYPERVLSIINKVYINLLKDNPYLDRSFITNYMQVSEMLLSGVELTRYPFLGDHILLKYFGMTTPEAIKQLSTIGYRSMYGEAEEFYSYPVTGTDKKMLNPWSLQRYVDQRDFDPFWIITAGIEYIEDYFLNEGVRKYIAQLADWKEISIENHQLPPEKEIMILNRCLRALDDYTPFSKIEGEIFLKYLLDYGYLISKRKDKTKIYLEIANKEIQKNWYYSLYNPKFTKFLLDLKNTNVFIEAFNMLGTDANKRESLLNFTTSLNNLFSNTTFGVYGDPLQAALYFTLNKSPRFKKTKAEDGRIINGTRIYADIMTARKSDKAGIVIETKYHKQSAEEALQQILDKGYYRFFELIDDYKLYVKQGRMYIGLHIDKHNRVTACYLVDSLDTKSKICV